MSDTTDPARTVVPPKKKGLTRRQKRRLSRGVQYAVFVAAVTPVAGTADWGQQRKQFAQAD
ncbi:amino acid ABC transporter permease, partial [Streptomyces sp. NPDC004542]